MEERNVSMERVFCNARAKVKRVRSFDPAWLVQIRAFHIIVCNQAGRERWYCHQIEV